MADLNSILDFVAAHSPVAAKSVQHRIQRSAELLPIHPRIGIQTEDPVIRRLTTAPYPYLIFYEVTDNDIIIHAIRHAARAPSKIPR